MKRSWSITKIFNIYSILIAAVLLISIVSLFYAYKIVQGLNDKSDKRYLSYQLADELRQSSDDLTRMARTYVTTGDANYEKVYLEILDIRNGQKARPENYNRIYWDLVTTGEQAPAPGTITISLKELMQKAGFTAEEFAKLQEGQDNSDDLVKTETIAMNAIRDINQHIGDSSFVPAISRDSAIAMMHNLNYHKSKFKIMKPIDQFFEILENRTQLEVEEYQSKNTFMIFLLVIFPFIIFGLLISFYITMKKRVLLPIAQLNNYSQIIAQGEFGSHIEVKHADEIGNLSSAINKVSIGLEEKGRFVSEIGKANLEVDLKPLSEKDSMGYALLNMRESLQRISKDEKKRNWVTEGLARFAELLRKNASIQELFDNVLVELVKYLNANQGSLFVLNNDDEKSEHLELLSCYAWNRKKFITKKIDKGEGLVGQSWMERDAIYLTNLPEDYVTITSGLGESSPRSIFILPLKTNEQIFGVIELASFNIIESHEREFLHKVGENIASVLATSRIAVRTQKLLEQTQNQAEELRNQEEEMRQNMEEITATQEDMLRKEREYLEQIAALKNNLVIKVEQSQNQH